MNEEPYTELPKCKPKTSNSVTHWIMGCAITLLIAILLYPLFTGTVGGKGHNKARTISNVKQIGLALFEFENDYEFYPNESTATIITTDFPEHGHDLSGKSSNVAFRQLMAAGIAPSEEMFYAKGQGVRHPDGIIIPGEAMKKGEVGFSYISGLSTKDDPLTPLVLTPLIAGTTKFDHKPFDGKALILHIDQSVSTHIISKDGHVYDKGIDILSAKHPVWKGKVPDIRYPD